MAVLILGKVLVIYRILKNIIVFSSCLKLMYNKFLLIPITQNRCSYNDTESIIGLIISTQ